MNDRDSSRTLWIVVGVVAGMIAGTWSPTGPLVAGGLGALIAAVLTSPSSTREGGARAIREFLEGAFLSGVLDEKTYRRLLERLPDEISVAAATTSQEATTPRAATTATRDVFAPPAPRLPAPSQPAPPAPSKHAPAVTTPPSPPSRPTRSDQRPVASGPPDRSSRPKSLLDAAPFLRPVVTFWRSLRADFGVQGLGSLGVLLVFTATLGFVIFAFSEVGTSFRPVAELMVPIVLFGLSRFLRGRSAPFMAAALEGLAGAVTPIMVFAAFMDGAPVPPDPERGGLVAVLAVASIGLAAIYGWVSVRRASSPLRYLVAPLVWLAVGVLGMAIDEQASAALFSLVLVAIAATPWIPSRPPASSLRRAAEAMVIPGLATASAFLLVFGLAEGWPVWPMLVGGLAAIAALEGSRDRVPQVWIAEAAVVAVTSTAASVGLGAPWAGALAVGAALALAERWIVAGSGRIALAGFAAVAAAGALASAAAPGPLLGVALALSVWSHARRVVSAAQLSVVPDVVGAVAPGVAAVALGWLTDPWIGLVAVAGTLLALAVVVRTRMASDVYLAAGIVGYAAVVGVVGVAGIYSDLIGEPGLVAGALAMAASAVAVVPGRVDGRVWLGSALAVAAWFVAGDAAGWAASTIAYGLGIAGLGLVVAALRVPGSVGGHLALVGHIFGAIALPLVIDDPARIAVLLGFIAGWSVEVASEPAGSPLQRLAGSPELVDASWVAAIPVLGGLPLLALAIVAETHPAAGLAGGVLVFAATAVAYGLVAGLPVWRHALTQEALVFGVGASVISIFSSATFDPSIASDRALQITALAAAITGVVVSGRRVHPLMHWYAWALTVPMATLLGLAAGIAVDQLHWVAIGWGVVVSIAALVADDTIAGRRDPYLVRTWWLLPPFVIGVLAGTAGIGIGLAAPVGQMWPVALAAALWSGVLAYLLCGGAVTYVTWSATAVAYASALVDAGYDPLRDPALLTWAALALLAFGVVLPRASSFGRLDAPPLITGLAVGAVAVGAGFAAESTALTWAPMGAALLVVAALKREWMVLAPLGSLLVIGAAALEGPWYLTAALAAHSVALGLLARLVDGDRARAAQWASAVLGAGAWASLIWALDPSLESAVVFTSAASSVVAVAAAVLVARDPNTSRHTQWSGPWVAVSLAAMGLAVAAGIAGSALPWARWSLVAGSLIWLTSTCVAATRLDVEELRLATLACVGASVAIVGWAGEFSVTAWSMWTLGLAALATTAGAAAAASIDRLGWRTWFVAGAGGLHITGTVFAAQLLPDRSLLILALLALGGAAVVADLVFGIRGARLLAPGLGFGAWIAFVTELGSADVQWYAPPFALAVIVDLELLRRQRRTSGAAPTSTEEMVVVELVAMALAIGPALVQVVFDHLAYGLLAIAWGAAVAVWGTATRVRRRVIAGGGGAALGALLMIAVPLAELLPEFRGPTLWVAVFAVGAVLIAIAATLEQTRRRIVELTTSFAAMTDGWE